MVHIHTRTNGVGGDEREVSKAFQMSPHDSHYIKV